MLTTLLDRDHALTDRGIRQARNFHRCWKEEEEAQQHHEHVLSNLNLDSGKGDSTTCYPSNNNIISADKDNPLGPLDDAPQFEADLLGLNDISESAEGGTTKSLLSNDPWSTPVISPGHMSPTTLNSLASSPGAYESILQAFAEREANANNNSTINTTDNSIGFNNHPNTPTSRPAMSKKDSLSLVSGSNSLLPTEDEEGEDEEEEEEADGGEEAGDIYDENMTELERQSAALTAKFSRSATLNEIKTRRQDYRKMFLAADSVYSSPLTRAIETALVALEGHKALETRGLVLTSVIREIKGVGGLDSVGVACGSSIADRVASELEAKLGKERAEQLMINSIHVNDAANPWWTNTTSFDNRVDQHDRVSEFISFSRYCEGDRPIFVGHSLFFKLFYSRRVSTLLAKVRPELSSNLKRHRLGNATILAVTVLYSSENDFDCTILDADLIFGGSFQKHTNGRGKSLSQDLSPHGHMPEKKSGLSSVLEKAQYIFTGSYGEDTSNTVSNNGLSNSRFGLAGQGDKLSSGIGGGGGGEGGVGTKSVGSSITESISSFAKKVVNDISNL